MSWYTRQLHEDATYWPVAAITAYGDRIYASPGAVKVHWMEERRLFIAKDGAEKHSKAIIFADRDVPEDSFLYRGISASHSPRAVPAADLVLKVEKLPTLRGDLTVYRLYL